MQLALAILVDHLKNSKIALEAYNAFHWNVIANLPLDGWQLDQTKISEWLHSKRLT